MNDISGWFESDEGAVLFDYLNIKDYDHLAMRLYLEYGDDCDGVDLEIEGEYADGTDVNDTFKELLAEINFLTN